METMVTVHLLGRTISNPTQNISLKVLILLILLEYLWLINCWRSSKRDVMGSELMDLTMMEAHNTLGLNINYPRLTSLVPHQKASVLLSSGVETANLLMTVMDHANLDYKPKGIVMKKSSFLHARSTREIQWDTDVVTSIYFEISHGSSKFIYG